jgi:hypothetical protein
MLLFPFSVFLLLWPVLLQLLGFGAAALLASLAAAAPAKADIVSNRVEGLGFIP